VRLGEGRYLLPLSQSGEIFPLAPLTRVPYTKPWFGGVVNLRGGLFGVVDMVLWLAPLTPARDDTAWSQVRLVTLNVELDVNCALMVDALLGLRGPASFVSVQPPPLVEPPYLGRCYLDDQGMPWQEIDLLQLSRTDAFLAIGV